MFAKGVSGRNVRGRLGYGVALVTLGIATNVSVLAQAPAGPPDGSPDGMPGMGMHRPPMERMLGPGGPGMHGDHGRWWDDPQTAEKFKLTDSQRKSMDDIFQQSRVSLVDLHASLEKQEIAMEPLMKADQPDEAKILEQIDRVAQARAELEKANARMLLGIRRQLTPEQWKQIEADRAARRAAGPPGASQGQGPHHWTKRGGPAGGQPPVPGADGAPAPGAPSGPGPMEPESN